MSEGGVRGLEGRGGFGAKFAILKRSFIVVDDVIEHQKFIFGAATNHWEKACETGTLSSSFSRHLSRRYDKA